MTKVADSSALAAELDRYEALAIAVSGGVDSMTLATFAHRRAPQRVSVIHAVSPAVPAAATARVRTLAAAEGWSLKVTGAGEFDDARYLQNPANRCYFCKTNLYDRIRSLTPDRIASGANLDDLGDYRPGLLAAAEREVVHPFVQAGLGKAQIRTLARTLGMADIAELPAQPCLASRVETGIAIDADDLAFVERAEMALAEAAPAASSLRCRITHTGVVLEIDSQTAARNSELTAIMAGLCEQAGRQFSGTRPYRRGAMFVRN